jgi:hypothetical protein
VPFPEDDILFMYRLIAAFPPSAHEYDFIYVIATMVWGCNHSVFFSFIVNKDSFTCLGQPCI